MALEWTLNLTGDENGNECFEATADGTNRRLIQDRKQMAEPGLRLYFWIRAYVPSSYTADFNFGFEMLNKSGAYVATQPGTIPNSELVKDAWHDYPAGVLTAGHAQTAFVEPYFQMPAAATVGQGTVKVSKFEVGSESPGGVRFVGATEAQVIEVEALAGGALTKDNATQLHPSSVPIIAVTQHEANINALNLIDGPAEPGATDGAQLGDNVYDENGLLQADRTLKNRFAANDNMLADPSFTDGNEVWNHDNVAPGAAGSRWSSTEGEGGTACMVIKNGVGNVSNSFNTKTEADLLISAGTGQTIFCEARAAQITSLVTGHFQFIAYCYDGAGGYLGPEYGDLAVTLNDGVGVWETVSASIGIDTVGTAWVSLGIISTSGTVNEFAVTWVRATKTKSPDASIIRPGLVYTNKVYDAGDPGNYSLDLAGTSYLNHAHAHRFVDAGNTAYYLEPAGTNRLANIYANDTRSYIFYDYNDTAFYANPASTSMFYDLRADVFYDRNDPAYYGNFAGTSLGYRIDAANQMRSPIYYDRNNTAFYGHFDGTSVLNEMQVNRIFDRQNTGYYWDGNGTSRMYRADLNDTRSDIFYDRNSTTYYLNPASHNNLWSTTITDNSGTNINGTGPQLELKASSNSSVFASFHRPGIHAVNFGLDTDNIMKMGGWSWTDAKFSWRSNGRFDATGEIRGDLFYDFNNTGTYLSGDYLNLHGDDPSIFLRDTNGRSTFIHCNSNRLYFLGSTTNNATTWAQVNGQWPAYCEIVSNFWRFGGAADFIGTVASNTSDERLKENFKPFDDPIAMVMQLEGGTHDWKVELCKSLGYTPDPEWETGDVSLKAGDVMKVLPQATPLAPFDSELNQETLRKESISGEDYRTVIYDKVVPLLVEVDKAQQRQYEKQEKKVVSLERKLKRQSSRLLNLEKAVAKLAA